MRTYNEIIRYQKLLATYRDTAKATIASAQPNTEEFTEAIKVFLRCDGAIEALNWAMDLGVADFRFSPAMAQQLKNAERSTSHSR
jgi:hypothetical protein